MGTHIIAKSPKRLHAADDIRFVLDSIRRIVQALRVSSRAAEKRVGLSGAQLFILQQLRGQGSLSVNELAERTFTHQSSVSEVVHRLVDKRLVARKQARDDGRRAELSLSSLGKLRLRNGPDPAQNRMIAALGKMNERRRLQLGILLGQFVRDAGLSAEMPGLFFEDLPASARTAGKAGKAGKKGVKISNGKS